MKVTLVRPAWCAPSRAVAPAAPPTTATATTAPATARLTPRIARSSPRRRAPVSLGVLPGLPREQQVPDDADEREERHADDGEGDDGREDQVGLGLRVGHH